MIHVAGDGPGNSLGISIAAREIGSDGNQMMQVAAPLPPGPLPAPPASPQP